MTYPAYAKSLAEILDDTPDEVIESYLVVRTALALSPYLGMNTDAWQAQRTLLEALTGIKKGAVGDRGEYCVGRVEETLGFAAGRYFVNETFGGESRERGTKVITDIVKAFKASLPHIDWMDKESARAAAEKVSVLDRFSDLRTSYHHRPTQSESKSDTLCLQIQKALGLSLDIITP